MQTAQESILLLRPKGVKQQLADIFVELRKEPDCQKRIEASPHVTLLLTSGNRVSGLPLNYELGKQDCNLTLWLEGTDGDVLVVSADRIEALVLHSVHRQMQALFPEYNRPLQEGDMPSKLQVKKRAIDLTRSLANAGGKNLEFNIRWAELPGSTDDKGTNASPTAMYWLMEAMVKTEAALRELFKEPDYKKEILASTKEIQFGGGTDFSFTRTTGDILLCKIAFVKEKQGFFNTQPSIKEAILNIY